MAMATPWAERQERGRFLFVDIFVPGKTDIRERPQNFVDVLRCRRELQSGSGITFCRQNEALNEARRAKMLGKTQRVCRYFVKFLGGKEGTF